MVSIIVPVYNAEKYVIKTIESVVAQTYEDWELILVDDLSTDGSVSVIRNYLNDNPDTAKKIRLIAKEVNEGAAETRNKGVALSKGRYIAFLDADDIWLPEKLEKEIQFMNKHDAGFVFAAYEFGNENAEPNGKMVRVPKTLSYKQALTRTIIFTSTVLFDTEKIPKELIHMPSIASEDTACWWQILKRGYVAYGLDEPLVIYRRPASSLSSNKSKATKRIWDLYINIAGLSKVRAFFCVFLWAMRASLRRFITDTVRAHIETIKRFSVLQLSILGLILCTCIYSMGWFEHLYPILSLPRISQDGYNFGGGLKLFFRGHILIIAVYFALLLFLSNSAGGLRTGYLKPSNIFVSESMALLITNIITYFQLSLMRNWLMPIRPFMKITFEQVIFVGLWAFVIDAIYRHVFPPRETLVVDLEDVRHIRADDERKLGRRAVDDIKLYEIKRRKNAKYTYKDTQKVIDRFNSRSDIFNVMKVMRYSGDLEIIKRECLRWYGCVVITGGNDLLRKEVIQFCYEHRIRVYVIPEFGDILMQGTELVDLFDSPILELREYSARWEERAIKRAIDLLLGIVLLICLLPYIVFRAATGTKVVKVPVYAKGGKVIYRYSLEENAYSIKPDIMSLINVIKGEMSLVGPSCILAEYKDELRTGAEQDDDYHLHALQTAERRRMKPGIVGYYQIYGAKDATHMDILKMDTFYMQHFGLLNDFKLMLQGISKKINKKNIG